jgi:hypothetical protein
MPDARVRRAASSAIRAFFRICRAGVTSENVVAENASSVSRRVGRNSQPSAASATRAGATARRPREAASPVGSRSSQRASRKSTLAARKGAT